MELISSSSLGGAYGSPLLGLDDDENNPATIFLVACVLYMCRNKNFKVWYSGGASEGAKFSIYYSLLLIIDMRRVSQIDGR